MGFAAKWAAVMGEPQPPTPKDKLDRMDTIRGGQPEQGSSVHIVHTVHKGARLADSEAKGNSVHCVHIVHKDSTQGDLRKGASALGPEGTGLEWVTCPPEYDAEKYGDLWAAFDLADLARLYSLRIVRAGERVLAVYPPALEPELIAYAGSLLAEARTYFAAHLDKLPALPPAEAVKAILEIIRQHPGLRFCRGDSGSRWPLYPKAWTAGQRATLQSLWFAAGDALDHDEFEGVDA